MRVESEELEAIRDDLAEAFHGLLMPQDQAPWRPHVTIQNKVAPREAQALQQQLARDLRAAPAGDPRRWRHGAISDGPWEPIEAHAFRR